MTEMQNANVRFNTLWEEIGAKRVTIGDEDKGVEIIVDADLSIFNILEKLKLEAETIHNKGKISSEGVKAVQDAVEAIKEELHRSNKREGWFDRFKKHFHKD